MNGLPRAACLAAVCAIATAPARAALWLAEPSMELSCGANDNYGLAFDRKNRVATMSVNGGLVASRSSERTSTHLNANVVGLALRGDLHQDEWQDSLTLDHAYTGPRDNFGFTAKTARDDTRQTPTSGADLLVARGLQRSNELGGSWMHALTERLSTTAAAGLARTRYSAQQQGAHDYSNASGSGSLRWLADERSALSASASHQDYRTLDGSVRSQTDSLTFGGSYAAREIANASLTLGAYRSRTAVKEAVLACTTTDCQTLTVLLQTGHVARWGLQYGANVDGQLTETTRLSAAASRQLDPSGAGATVRTDSLRASVDHSWSETLSGTAAWSRSSGTFLGGLGGGTQSRLQGLSLALSKSLTPRWTLRANADWKRSSQSQAGGTANAASVAVTLRYEWQRLEAHR